MMPPRAGFGADYLRLTLEIDKHITGYVDAYYGPPELAAEVKADEKKSPAALREELGRLREALSNLTADPQRVRYLATHLRAIDCTLRRLDGEAFAYPDEVNALYDIQPSQADETIFLKAHRILEEVLPGTGGLAARLEAWRRPYELSAAALPRALDMARTETRRRTRALIQLVEGEDVEVTLTRDQPWSAYNWYQGQAHSRIEFNTDIPVSALDVLDLFAHEAYPGHHTEAQLKEQHLYAARGYAELASALLHSPAAVIAEGIATTALEVIFPEGGHSDWVGGHLLPACGLPEASPDMLRRVAQARSDLRRVNGNTALLYHTGQLSEAQALDYLHTYALATEARARQMLRFIADPLFRAYVFTYTAGYDLIARASRDGDKAALFKHLLVEPWLPSDLAAT